MRYGDCYGNSSDTGNRCMVVVMALVKRTVTGLALMLHWFCLGMVFPGIVQSTVYGMVACTLCAGFANIMTYQDALHGSPRKCHLASKCKIPFQVGAVAKQLIRLILLLRCIAAPIRTNAWHRQTAIIAAEQQRAICLVDRRVSLIRLVLSS